MRLLFLAYIYIYTYIYIARAVRYVWDPRKADPKRSFPQPYFVANCKTPSFIASFVMLLLYMDNKGSFCSKFLHSAKHVFTDLTNASTVTGSA